MAKKNIRKNSQRWKVGSKFSDFKTFVKTNGLDSVVYENLSTYEKRVYNGLEQYETRRFVGTKFGSESILKNQIVQDMARFNGVSTKEFIKKNKKFLLDYFENDNIPLSKNSQNVRAFIDAHKGRLFDKGELTTKENLLFKFSMIETDESSSGKKAIIIYNFEARSLSDDLNFIGYENPYKSGHFNRWKSGKGKQTVNKKNKQRVPNMTAFEAIKQDIKDRKK